MDETLTVYANPPATTEDCINIPFDKSKGFSSILCGVYNNPTESAQTNTSYPDNVVPIHTGAQEQAAYTQRMIAEAQFASLKATAAESARLDAQQQQVKRLIEGQQFTLNHMKVENERNRHLQLDLQNKLQLSFTKQRQHSDAATARSVQSTQANFKAQMAKNKASMQATRDQLGASRAWEQANKLAEQQKQEHERQLQQEMARIAEAQNNLMAEQRRLQEEIARRNDEHNRLVAEQHRQAEEAQQRATSLALEQKHQQETRHHHAQDRQLRAGISQDRRQKIDTFMQEMKNEISCIKNEYNQTIAKYNNANKSKEDRNRCSEAKLNYANKNIELAERFKSRAEEMMRETQNWISGLDSHFPMIHSHFDHQIKNINPVLDHATRIHLEAHWNGLRQIQINDKHHDIKIAQNEYNIIAHTLTDRNYNITEGRIIKQIAESELTHTGNELKRENEALDRMSSYKTSLADAKRNAELLISSENNYDSVISSIDSLKNKAESWLQQADDRIKMRNTHPPLINAHYDANINRTLSMALPTSSKQLLEKEWNNQRNLELDYKKGQINASIQEHKFIKEIIQARNIQLDEAKQIAARVALAAKSNHILIATNEIVGNKPIDSLSEKMSRLLPLTQPAKPNEAPAPQDSFLSHANQALAIAATTGLAPSALLESEVALRLKNAAAGLSRVATAHPAGAIMTTIVAGLYPATAGEGSGKVPGGSLFIKTLPAELLNLPSYDVLHTAAKEQRTIAVDYRGRLALANGEMQIELFKTGRPTQVRVVYGVPQGNGTYLCTLPGTDDLPSRTILINPARAPGADGLGAIITPDTGPKAIANTGGQTQPAVLPTITTYPDLSEIGFDDLIMPGDRENGYKPIYVMLSQKKGGYGPNKGAVGNMGEFFAQPGFGSQLKDISRKTAELYDGQSIYRANDNVGSYIKKGYKYYLDGKHKNHIELFDSNNKFSAVLNLDGTFNLDKTMKAQAEKRKLKK